MEGVRRRNAITSEMRGGLLFPSVNKIVYVLRRGALVNKYIFIGGG